MVLQLLEDERTIFIAFHFFIAGVFAGIFLLRSQLKEMKKTIHELEQELQQEYEDKVIRFPGTLSNRLNRKN